MHLLELPASGALSSFVILRPTEIVSIYIKLSLYIGAVLAVPSALFNAWQYTKPAIAKETDVSIISWAAAAVTLFAAGTIFSFMILLPAGYKFLINLSKEVAIPMITLESYISFALSIIVIGGFMFEMPVISALLTRLRLVTPMFLRSKRKEAIFILCVIAAIITPTTDVFNMLLFVLPMIALFEISVFVSSAVYKMGLRNTPTIPDYSD